MLLPARIVLVALAVAAAVTPARAGIADSPLPVLNGVRAKHLYSVPGVIRLGTFETVFICTSAEKEKTIRLGVEVFGGGGGAPQNDVEAGNGAIDLEAGDTAVIATGETGAFSEDEIIDLNTNAGGSARIVATSTNAICTAMLVDFSAPPAAMVQLTIVAKTKQKAAN
ncbi:MAG: hypothetical protein AB1689_16610 [Thermodesulfobacteriota bacterium]